MVVGNRPKINSKLTFPFTARCGTTEGFLHTTAQDLWLTLLHAHPSGLTVAGVAVVTRAVVLDWDAVHSVLDVEPLWDGEVQLEEGVVQLEKGVVQLEKGVVALE